MNDLSFRNSAENNADFIAADEAAAAGTKEQQAQNPYLPTMTTIAAKTPQGGTVLFKLCGHVDFAPGQFIMLTVPGYGEAPFSLTGDLEICVRDTGRLTHRLHSLNVSDTVGWRGPFGTSFDIAPDGNAVYIAGGIGMAALRPAISARKGIVLLGARNKNAVLFPQLATYILTDDMNDGLLPDLVRRVALPNNPVCFLCGPPTMYRPIIDVLLELGVPKDCIVVSLERHMSCGIGKCGHCRSGGLRVCMDGPVFIYGDIEGRESIL